jgi:hypothetical protein
MLDRLLDLRMTMLDMLGGEGAQRFPILAHRIRAGADAQALWFARADLMAVLAEVHGEDEARARIDGLSNMFDGLLPKGLMSRPTSLMMHQ